MAGVASAWFFYMIAPGIPAAIQQIFKPIYLLLENKYFFDRFSEIFIAGGCACSARALWKGAMAC